MFRTSPLSAEIPSSYAFYPARGYHRIQKIISANRRELKECRESFIEELNYHDKKNLTRYGLNIIIYDGRPEKYCKLVDKCCNNWINELNFRIINKENYKNHDSFENTAQRFLYSRINQAIEYEWFL